MNRSFVSVIINVLKKNLKIKSIFIIEIALNMWTGKTNNQGDQALESINARQVYGGLPTFYS